MSLLYDIFVYINNVYRLLAFFVIMSIKIWVQKVAILNWISGPALRHVSHFFFFLIPLFIAPRQPSFANRSLSFIFSFSSSLIYCYSYSSYSLPFWLFFSPHIFFCLILPLLFLQHFPSLFGSPSPHYSTSYHCNSYNPTSPFFTFLLSIFFSINLVLLLLHLLPSSLYFAYKLIWLLFFLLLMDFFSCNFALGLSFWVFNSSTLGWYILVFWCCIS